MLITEISVCKKNSNRVNVYGDQGFLFACYADIAVMHGLALGMDFSESQVEAIKHEDECARAYSSAIIILGIRPHSCHEVLLKLKKRGISDFAANLAIEKLIELKLIDDEEFARLYAAELSSRNGKKVIYQKLLAKGIESDIARTVTDSCENNIALSHAFDMANARYSHLPSEERKQKVMRSLAAKGFDYTSIRRVFEGIDEK